MNFWIIAIGIILFMIFTRPRNVLEGFVINDNQQQGYLNDNINLNINNPCYRSRDPHCFLMSSLLRGDKDINEMVGVDQLPSNVGPYKTRAALLEKCDDLPADISHYVPDVRRAYYDKLHCPSKGYVCLSKKDQLFKDIKDVQPKLFDEPCVITYYDEPRYWDARYPVRMLPIKYASNMKNIYLDGHESHVYPFYRMAQKDLPAPNSGL